MDQKTLVSKPNTQMAAMVSRDGNVKENKGSNQVPRLSMSHFKQVEEDGMSDSV